MPDALCTHLHGLMPAPALLRSTVSRARLSILMLAVTWHLCAHSRKRCSAASIHCAAVYLHLQYIWCRPEFKAVSLPSMFCWSRRSANLYARSLAHHIGNVGLRRIVTWSSQHYREQKALGHIQCTASIPASRLGT